MSTQAVARPSDQPGPPLGTGRDWRRRLLFHHVPIALASVVVLVLFMGLSPFANVGHGDTSFGFQLSSLQPGDDSYVSRLTIATGYIATGLLALTLLIGPTNLLLRRRNPVSSYLRRDLGTWTAIFSVVHVTVSFQTLGGGVFTFVEFFFANGTPLITDFGLGNWTGLAALVIVVGLLAISTTRSVRELKPERWKSLQRVNYTLFALVVLHAVFYGALQRPTSPFTLVLIFTVIAVLLGQAIGISLYRRRERSRRSAPAVQGAPARGEDTSPARRSQAPAPR
jgi:methionine sulfoxide reductase heme-binding subunit